jgi:ribosomal protein S18 acetylase RimI-like enzyme
METIKSLKGIHIASLYQTFKEAFANYELQLSERELEVMILRRGYVAELSFGAFDEDNLVAFTLNGIGVFNGLTTAYDTGTGTIEAYRGKGLATKIFEYSVPFLKEAGIKQCLLEVLQHNEKAISIYKKVGFEISREFNYYTSDIEAVKLKEKAIDDSIVIRNIEFTNDIETSDFHDFTPSWQNNYDAIKRRKDDFEILGAYLNDKMIGYCVVDPATGDITLISVSKNFRRSGIGTALLQKALEQISFDSIKIINTETSCSSLSEFLKHHSFEVAGKQFEMIKTL